VADPQEQIRQAVRDMRQELTRALESAGNIARQAVDDVSRLVGDAPGISRFRQPPDPDSPAQLIRELARLREEGLVTDEEFAAKKADLLARM
jgi:Short C-terminal domain